MKNKNFLMMLLAAVMISTTIFTGCEKCYECVKHDFCMECTGTFNGLSIGLDECYETESARQEDINDFEDTYSSAICIKTQTPISGSDKEVCAKKGEIDSEVEANEAAGYICKSI